jgi:hypothetical protein
MRMRINENNSWCAKSFLGQSNSKFRQAQSAMEGNMEGYAALDLEGIRYPIKIGDSSDQIIQYK